MPIQYKVFESEVKATDDEALVIKHIISSETKDRGGDVMRVSGMRIVGKPVVLMLHGKGPMGSEPVGKPLSVGPGTWKGHPVIMAETQFFPDETGRRLYEKAKNGYLPNWSIGYTVQKSKDLLKDGRYDGRDVTDWTLLEWSPVGVPMNPEAQTLKDFLDADDAGKRPEIKEQSHWFGIADEKTCTGCGACKKPEEEKCPTCKGEIAFIIKDGEHVYTPLPCEKCEPEKYAEAMKTVFPPKPDEETEEPCITCGKKLWKEWTKELPYKALRVYCKAGCEIVVKTSEGGFMMEHRTLKGLLEAVYAKYKEVKGTELEISEIEKFKKEAAALGITLSDDPMKAIDERIAALEVQWKAMEGSFKTLYDCHVALDKKMEPLLKTLPPEPEGGKEGEEEHHDNPPEKKAPPRLVIVREEETPEAKQQAQKAQILAVAREAIGEVVKQEIDRMKGRVP